RGIGYVNVGTAAHGGGEGQLASIRRPSGRKICPAERGKGHRPAELEGVHAKLHAPIVEGGERHAGAIGRQTRRKGDGCQAGELLLAGAVVIHLPDFFVAAARAYESDFALRHARYSTAEPENNVIREAVRDAARAIGGASFAIFLAQNLR